MADETFRTKGAIEPNGSFTSTSDNMFRWKGAIEPTGTANRIKGPFGMPFLGPFGGPIQ